tara:strand:+ start:597 stop:1409 length:813 start_codon:yes stop_codon:yes gene_type:complete
MKVSELPIIFVENPISRFYLKVLIDKNIFDTEIIYLNNTFSIQFLEKFNFKSINHYPLLFLKKREIIYFIDQVEDFFNLERGFIKSAYNFKNINFFKNISKINSRSINSEETINFLKSHKSFSYLNTGKQILKEVFLTKKSFFHIHPGYLPKVKGADGTLHSIQKFNEVGCSFFEMTKKIDDGKILNRIKLDFKQFDFKNINFFDEKDLYRLWFSFFDPALRAYMFKSLIEKKIDTSDMKIYKTYDQEDSNYYSFMSENNKKITFNKIFK